MTRKTPTESAIGFDQRVILLTPAGRDQALVGKLLQNARVEWGGCGDRHQLLRAIKANCGPIILAEEALGHHGADQLMRLLDEQPPWSDLPIIVLVRPGQHKPQGLIRQLVDRPGIRWLRRPVDPQALLALVRMAIEARQRQQEVGRLLREQRQLNEQLSRRAEQLQHLTVAVIEAEDRQRQHLSQLLHDDLQQILLGAKLHAKVLGKHIEPQGPAGESWQRVSELIDRAQLESRSLSHELFPAVLHSADSSELLRWIADNGRSLYGLEIDLRIDNELGSTSPPIGRFVYRTLRELLCNVAKHAGVEAVQVSAWRVEGEFFLAVVDRGAGFNPEQLERQGGDEGIGLRTIRERLDALGGWITIESQPGKGSRFTLCVPAATDEPPTPSDAPEQPRGEPEPADPLPRIHTNPPAPNRARDQS